ncbi:hypothetical protein HPP92_014156 [Vanilla planifolia]|uniref:C2H2-type domain-containing protein n=1 Tax=Vanilla planifolia TaxID=51239 RepID=A0A835QGB1_VANPL|nr:hypothetical protein HPP92_014587 [Vanilla planifolia]KAG0474470.1 hypothetical protein HPP92_014156 [Vanilla planifolia]
MWGYGHRTGEVNEDDSWEARAFAADAGATWPPKFYPCNYCGREFRSAQALGGHMNVHRRDRAVLQQQRHEQGHDPPSISVAGGTAAIAPGGGLFFNTSEQNHEAEGGNFSFTGSASMHRDCSVLEQLRTGGEEEVDLELRLGW